MDQFNSKLDSDDNIVLPELHVLVIDDQAENLSLLEQCLTELGFKCQCVASSELALAHLEEQVPDLILLDESLPDASGFALLERIHMAERTCHIPIIVMTSRLVPPAQPVLLASELYANGYQSVETLTKPINARTLAGMMQFYRQLLASRSLVSRLHNHNDHLLEIKNEGVIALDKEGGVVYVNNSSARLLGMKPSELVGVYVESIFEKRHDSVVSKWQASPIAIACENQHIVQVEKARYKTAYQQSIEVKFAAVPVKECADVEIVIAFQQLPQTIETGKSTKKTATKKRENRLNVNLSAPYQLREKAMGLIKQQETGEFQKAFLYLDLDHFDYIVDQLGHAVADELLQSLSEHINLMVGCQGDWLQLEGDCYGIVTSYDCAEEMAKALLSSFQLPFKIMGHELYLTASIGLSACNLEDDAVSAIFTSADEALQISQELGGGVYRWAQGHCPQSLSLDRDGVTGLVS